ncbi:MAG: IS200/IS605 family transposase [Bacteroidales bacterium]|nr:IS200/IS605 family transposase [Bacteroidales bacterium]MCF8350560.1 IS200/IS605 family transposase [Bacteroidales bacterium]MCF8377072.1 IS200/IS605 family transposase [Bacteroidales bacterium]MCF8400946.1 IS200/IS605 family transposase [Bacteroidales bacterium]
MQKHPMAHSHIKIWIHAILGTKNRTPLIKIDLEEKIYQLIRKEVDKTKCVLNIMNGTANHVHLLFLLHPDKNIREVIHQIKGGSSFQINQSGIMRPKFLWQVGLSAYSVSESGIKTLRKYIQNQREHHTKMTFEEEYQRFIELHGLLKKDKNG